MICFGETFFVVWCELYRSYLRSHIKKQHIQQNNQQYMQQHYNLQHYIHYIEKQHKKNTKKTIGNNSNIIILFQETLKDVEHL